MMIIGVILAALAVLILIVVLRAVMLKPTEAKEAKVKLDTSQRSVEYGKRLAKMIQKETISCLNQEDRSEFYEFHEVLEELFPNVHKN